MDFIGQYIDPTRVTVDELDEGIRAKKPGAALQKALSYQYGLNAGLPLSGKEAKALLYSFRNDPVCAAQYASTLHIEKMHNRGREKEVALFMRPHLTRLMALAKQGNHQARIQAGTILMLGIGTKENLAKAEEFLMQASAPDIRTSGSLDEPGDAIARFNFSIYYALLAARATEPAQKSTYSQISRRLKLAAAHGGNLMAQYEMGLFFNNPSPDSPLIIGKNQDDLRASAEDYFSRAHKQGLQVAGLALAEIYRKTERIEQAREIAQRLAGEGNDDARALLETIDIQQASGVQDSFTIPNTYVDPRSIPLEIVRQQRQQKPGNPNAAVLESFIVHAGFGHGSPLTIQLEADALMPYFTANDPTGSAGFGLLLAQSPGKLNDGVRVIKYSINALLKAAEDGNYYARIISIRAISKGIGVPKNIPLAVKLLRELIGPSPQNKEEALSNGGDAVAQYELATLLYAQAKNSGDAGKREALTNESALLFLAAATGGHALAQQKVGVLLMDENPPTALAAGLTREDILGQAEHYLILAHDQNIIESNYALAKLYILLNRNEDAITAYREFLQFGPKVLVEKSYREAQVELADLFDTMERYTEAYPLYLEVFEAGDAGAFRKTFSYARSGRPGVPSDQVLAYRVTMKAVDPRSPYTGLVKSTWQDLNAHFQARAWVRGANGDLRRHQKDDGFTTHPLIVLPENIVDAFHILYDEATKPDAVISADLAIALAEHHAGGFGCDVNHIEAQNWYLKAANLGSLSAAQEAIDYYTQGRPDISANPLEAIRLVRRIVAVLEEGDSKNKQQVRSRQQVRIMRAIEKSILEPTDGTPSPILTRDGKNSPWRPLRRDEPLDNAVLASTVVQISEAPAVEDGSAAPLTGTSSAAETSVADSALSEGHSAPNAVPPQVSNILPTPDETGDQTAEPTGFSSEGHGAEEFVSGETHNEIPSAVADIEKAPQDLSRTTLIDAIAASNEGFASLLAERGIESDDAYIDVVAERNQISPIEARIAMRQAASSDLLESGGFAFKSGAIYAARGLDLSPEEVFVEAQNETVKRYEISAEVDKEIAELFDLESEDSEIPDELFDLLNEKRPEIVWALAANGVTTEEYTARHMDLGDAGAERVTPLIEPIAQAMFDVCTSEVIVRAGNPPHLQYTLAALRMAEIAGFSPGIIFPLEHARIVSGELEKPPIKPATAAAKPGRDLTSVGEHFPHYVTLLNARDIHTEEAFIDAMIGLPDVNRQNALLTLAQLRRGVIIIEDSENGSASFSGYARTAARVVELPALDVFPEMASRMHPSRKTDLLTSQTGTIVTMAQDPQ